jgi:2-polyprenyl-3-methyl-5-hydroxy-6-metoxy-1,4-benzoquinol methylase
MSPAIEAGMLENVRCALCGADDTRPVTEIDGFHIVCCRQCGLIYVNPRYAEELLQEIYTEQYYDHDGIKNGLEFFGYDGYLSDEENIKLTFRKRLQTIERLSHKGRLLDVGCATGFFLDLARAHGWEVLGTEVSAFSAHYARERFGLDVRLGALGQLSLEAQSFEAVTMWDVIEHVADPLAELREVHRILRPEGLLSIITPDAGSWVARLLGRRWEEFRRVREHIYFFSRRTLAETLRRAGFDVVRVERADKIFYLGPAIQRLKYYTWDGVVTSIAARLVYRLGLDRIRVNVNPLTKITVYARKQE